MTDLKGMLLTEKMVILSSFLLHIEVMLLLPERLSNIAQMLHIAKKMGGHVFIKAVKSGNMEFVEFILGEPRLQKLVNMRSSKGKTALHYAVQKCDPKIVAALLDKKIDLTILGSDGNAAAWELRDALDSAKTLNWVCMFAIGRFFFPLMMWSFCPFCNHR